MSCRYRLAKKHLSRPLPELRQQPADKTVVGHAVGLHDGGFDSNYNNGKSEGLSMFSVGDVLVCLPPSAWFLL